jgi:hypothetical protein
MGRRVSSWRRSLVPQGGQRMAGDQGDPAIFCEYRTNPKDRTAAFRYNRVTSGCGWAHAQERRGDSTGFPLNPLGFGYRDLGLGTFLRSGFGSGFIPNSDWVELAGTVLPEGVLSQGLRQEPKAARPLLQYARCDAIYV